MILSPPASSRHLHTASAFVLPSGYPTFPTHPPPPPQCLRPPLSFHITRKQHRHLLGFLLLKPLRASPSPTLWNPYSGFSLSNHTSQLSAPSFVKSVLPTLITWRTCSVPPSSLSNLPLKLSPSPRSSHCSISSPLSPPAPSMVEATDKPYSWSCCLIPTCRVHWLFNLLFFLSYIPKALLKRYFICTFSFNSSEVVPKSCIFESLQGVSKSWCPIEPHTNEIRLFRSGNHTSVFLKILRWFQGLAKFGTTAVECSIHAHS